jgi:alkanesulfonate monooxygenase SsuD/methylene tetrahydromethanopterin reductase-like flavin-dependent oxidoreductase (luciferase family)
MPIRVTPQDIKSGRATLDELAEAAGRDPRSIEIMVYGEASDPEMLKRFEEAGASRVTVRLQVTEGDAALTELERMAEQLFA